MSERLLDSDELYQLAEQVKEWMDRRTLQRGLGYALGGHVLGLVREGGRLRAHVLGNWKYDVRVDWQELRASRCDCPVDGLCKHIGAVFFAEYGKHYKAADFWRFYEGEGPALHKAKKGIKPPRFDEGPEGWTEYLAEAYREMARQRAFPSYTSGWGQIVPDFASRAVVVAINWPDEPKKMFAFLCRLFELAQREKAESHLGYYGANGGSQQVYEEMLAAARELGREGIWSRQLEFVRFVAGFLRHEIFENPATRINRLMEAYRWLWLIFWKLPGMAADEGEYLLKNIEGAKERGGSYGYALMALAHLDVLDGRDSDAQRRLSESQGQQVLRRNDILHYPRTFFEAEDWGRLRGWLEWANSYTEDLYGADFQGLYHWWLAVGEHFQAWQEVAEILQGWPSAGLRYYGDYLFATGRYKEWVDIQLGNGEWVMDLPKEELKKVLEHDGRLILPLYHQGVSRCIEEKRRDSYKLAVRLLKKLRTVYKNEKRQTDWEAFFDQLLKQTSRLRAFREELERGKLIPGE